MGDLQGGVRREIEQLRKQGAELSREVERLRRARESASEPPRDVRLAVTCRNLDQSYPSQSANVFPIKFIDPHFVPNASGLGTMTKAERQTTPLYAMNVKNSFVEEGTVVECLWQPGLGPNTAGEWWFEHSASETTSLVLFELLTPLAPKGSALAFLETFDPVTGGYVTSETITVHDAWLTSAQPSPLEPYADMFTGPVGCRGTALFRNTISGMRHFNITWMARLARFIYVEVTGDLDEQAGTYECLVTGYWDQGYSPAGGSQGTITVHDPNNTWRRSGAGLLDNFKAIGLAVYRGDLNRYDFVTLEQISMLYTATLTADMLGTGALIDTQTIRPMSWGLYVHQEEPFPPGPIDNPRKLFGRKGDEVVIVVHDYRDKYEVLAVGQHLLRFRNSAQTAVPYRGLVEVFNAMKDADGMLLDVTQPTGSGKLPTLVSLFPTVAPGAIGVGTYLFGDQVGDLLYDAADGVPAHGEFWGPSSGTWKAKKGKVAFRIVGHPRSDAGSDLVVAQQVTHPIKWSVNGTSQTYTPASGSDTRTYNSVNAALDITGQGAFVRDIAADDITCVVPGFYTVAMTAEINMSLVRNQGVSYIAQLQKSTDGGSAYTDVAGMRMQASSYHPDVAVAAVTNYTSKFGVSANLALVEVGHKFRVELRYTAANGAAAFPSVTFGLPRIDFFT